MRKSFGTVAAVDGITVTVAPGKTLGIAGANGAGKTTFFNLVAGALRPDAGTITYGGQSIHGLRPDEICRLGIVRTFQTTATSPEQSVFENVAMAAAYGGARHRFPVRFTPAVIDAALDVLWMVGLEGVESRPAGELSVFDQRRLMLAAALATSPRLLMLDEPVGGLLPEEIDEVARIVEDIRGQGIALVVIEHVMSFLTRVCPERILIMHQGRELFEGTALEVSRNATVREAWLGDEIPLPAITAPR